MTTVGWLGVWLLAASVVVIFIEGAVAGVWTGRLAKRGRLLSEKLASDQAALRADVERLRAALEETEILWRPYRRLLRWVRHPLTVAVLQSYARRRTATR